MKVQTTRDWLDYVEAAGVLVSLVLALVALLFAKRSADAADESAQAADATAASAAEQAAHTRELVAIARNQHERLLRDINRRPEFGRPELRVETMFDAGDLTLGQLASLGHPFGAMGAAVAVRAVVLRASFENVGDRDADAALARIVVAASASVWRCGPWGQHSADVDLHDDSAMLQVNGREEPAHAHAWRISPLPPGQPEVLHVLLAVGAPGDYEVRLSIEHADAEPAEGRFVVAIPNAGEATVAALAASV